MKIFILEDDDLRISQFIAAGVHHDLTIAKSYDEAVKKFTPPYDFLLLDHDLADHHYAAPDFEVPKQEGTGLAFCKWLVDNHYPEEVLSPKVIIHSYNAYGAARMKETLWEYLPTITLPFGTSLLNWLEGLK